jgi:hypothetical protein
MSVDRELLSSIAARIYTGALEKLSPLTLPHEIEFKKREALKGIESVLRLAEKQAPPAPPTKPARIRCDDDTRAFFIDGKTVAENIDATAYTFIKAVVVAHPDPVNFRDVEKLPGMKGKHATQTKKKLPKSVLKYLKSGRAGYWIELPAK